MTNVLPVGPATLHAAPQAGGGFELAVVTADGMQVQIAIDRAELVAFSTEATDVLGGEPMSFHRAGMRLSARLERIKK